MNQRLRLVLRAPITWVAAISLLWSAVLAVDALPILRGPADWSWGYQPVIALNRIMPLIVGMILYVPVGLWLKARCRPAGLLIWASLGGVLLTLAAVWVRADMLHQLYAVTVSGAPTGWHMAAARIQNLPSTLRAWPEFMLSAGRLSSHMDHTPPGFILMYYATGHLLDRFPLLANWLAKPLHPLLADQLVGYSSGQEASAWIGMLMPVWGSLTVLPLYLLGKRVFGEGVGRWSALWWPLIPSFLLFAPLPNTAYALPGLLLILMLWEGLRNDRATWVIAAGLLMSVLSFLTFTYAPLLLLAGLLTLGEYWLKLRSPTSPRPPLYWPIQVGLEFALGLSVVWLIYYAATGGSFLSIWQTAQGTQADIGAAREYWHWLPFELNDFFMFTGWPFSLFAIAGCLPIVRNLARGRELKHSDVMLLAAWLTVFIIDIYGTPRGEWGRIMLFLSPWILFGAATAVEEAPASGRWLTAAQALIALLMVICLRVLPVGFRG